MKIQLKAHELTEGEIDFVSLVKHGANRQPFRIVKMDDLPEGKSGLMDKVKGFFGEEQANVAAFFVKHGEEEKYAQIIKDAGFKIDDTQKLGTVTMYKQEVFDEDIDASFIALNEDMGLALDRVVKQFSSFPESSDFNENLGAQAFFPALHMSFEALAESIWNALNTSDSLDTASGMIDKNLSAFRKHVNGLVKNMPQSVIKMEDKLLRLGIEGSNVSDDSDGDVAKTDGDKPMTKIAEAMAGDLAGLNATEEKDKEALSKSEGATQRQVSEAADGAEIVFLDEDGKEISEKEFDELNKETDDKKKKKGKKMMKDADGNLQEIEEEDAEVRVQFFDENDKQLTKEEFEALEDDAKLVVKQGDKLVSPYKKETMTKADVLGQGMSAFSNASPGSAVVSSTSDTGSADRDEGLPAGFREMQKSVKKLEDGKIVEATARFAVNKETGDEIFLGYVEKKETETPEPQATGDVAEALAGPLNLIGKALNAQGETLKEIKEGLVKQSERVDSLVEKQEEAIKKSDRMTLVQADYDLDESLGTMNSHRSIEKIEEKEDVFKGLCPELEALEDSFRNKHGLGS